MEGRPKILIIDDEEVVRDSCTQILSGMPVDLMTANNGESGLQLVREQVPDLVFVDLKMPGISGFEVISAIRAYDPSIVTVVITGFSTVDSAVEAMKNGAYDFLPKPFTPDEFRVITQRGLEKRRLMLETAALRQERDMLQQHFAAIVSHELKAPLGSVQQNLYALAQDLEPALNPEQKARLERMVGSIDSLLKMIHGWLRAYSTDFSKLRESFTLVSISSVIAKAAETVGPHAQRKAVEILTHVEEGLPAVRGDEGTLVEAVVNLLGNAVKFSRLGEPVRVEAAYREGAVAISVIDTGVGIPPEELPSVIRGLARSKAGLEAERGSGLGLGITRRIIEAHNGSISVESDLGKGSTFTILLPPADTTAGGQVAADAAGAPSPLEGGIA
jgi:two-component system, sensor histidine kinase and response regulator